jgi:hypothetical protein
MLVKSTHAGTLGTVAQSEATAIPGHGTDDGLHRDADTL